jgi:phage gp45-like
MVIGCPRLSSLEQFLQPTYMPAIKKMVIRECTNLESVPVERFGGLPSLEELEVCNCPKINSQRLLVPSLKSLSLNDSGNLGDDIECRSLTTFFVSSYHLVSLTLNREKVPLLNRLVIRDCRELETLNGDWPCQELKVHNCPKINSRRLQAPSVKELDLEDSGNLGDDIDCRSLTTFRLSSNHLISLTLNKEKVPLLTDLTIRDCRELEILDGSWPILKSLCIWRCPRLKLEKGIVLPSSLQKLNLCDLGYFSARCLENLTSLESLHMTRCKHMYIPRDLWSSNRKSLQELIIMGCEDLVSIGGPEAIAHIPKVDIYNCPKLKEVQ